jgi:hypothetical protein
MSAWVTVSTSRGGLERVWVGSEREKRRDLDALAADVAGEVCKQGRVVTTFILPDCQTRCRRLHKRRLNPRSDGQKAIAAATRRSGLRLAGLLVCMLILNLTSPPKKSRWDDRHNFFQRSASKLNR